MVAALSASPWLLAMPLGLLPLSSLTAWARVLGVISSRPISIVPAMATRIARKTRLEFAVLRKRMGITQ